MFGYRIANNANLAVILKINSAAEYARENVYFCEYLTKEKESSIYVKNSSLFVLLRIVSTMFVVLIGFARIFFNSEIESLDGQTLLLFISEVVT